MRSLATRTDADQQGDDAHPQGDDAHPQGEDAHPQGEDAHPRGDDAHPRGDDAHPRGDDAHQQGEDQAMTTLDARIAELAGPQGGHVSRSQLLGTGMSTDQIRYRQQIGRLIPVHRGIYAVGHLPTEPLDLARGVLLASGARSALAGRSAAAFWGIERHWRMPLEVVTMTHRRSTATAIVHQATNLRRKDVVAVRGIRVTSAARTLLDMAPLLTDKRLTRAVEDLRHARRLTLRQIEDVLARNYSHRGYARLMAIVASRQPEPTRSMLEDAFQRMTAKYDLPVPQINVHVAGYRVDAYYPARPLVVELDGWMSHQTRQAFTRDRRQDAVILERTGIPTIRLTYEQTTLFAARTAKMLRSLLAGSARLGE